MSDKLYRLIYVTASADFPLLEMASPSADLDAIETLASSVKRLVSRHGDLYDLVVGVVDSQGTLTDESRAAIKDARSRLGSTKRARHSMHAW